MEAPSRSRSLPIFLLVAGLFAPSSPGVTAPVPESMLQALRYRLVGPFRGGRVNTVAGIPGDPRVYYFGAPGGGVWKTTDAGATWHPIFDDQPTGSIGAIAVADSDPNVVYVGTGDPKIRGNVSHGNGVYKSLDAGRTWTHLGLDDTRHIARIIVHPEDSSRLLVAAIGHFYGDNDERGIFLSEDGGASWDRVLYVDEKTGAADVAYDPNNPNIVFASLWQVRRTPWDLLSGGPGSGLYRSADGGKSWTRLDGHGLPEGVLGKIGVAVSPADSDRVYAIIEAREGGLYRSDDGGASWAHVNASHFITARAWYFMHVIPDPKNRDVVYVMNINFMKSIDGGRNFSVVDQYHVDNQALWIDPLDPQRMINGNDGGANISWNGGRTWTRSDDHQPLGQFYRVATDQQFPYHIYGGQQDYDTIAIASAGPTGGIGRTDWHSVGGCEMGWAAPDPSDPNVVYAGCTDGGISRYDHRTKRNQSVEPWPETNIGHGAGEAKYRFQWTAPILLSPHDPDVLYMASNMLLKSVDDGMSWTPVSPDLTRDDKSKQEPAGGPITRDNVGTEVYGTIFALDESPLRAGVLWAGSDDGLVHLSRDGGESWSNVTPSEMPEWSRIGMIDASPHEPAAAYLAVDRHELDDYQPYVYKTSDYGASWTLAADGIPDGTFVRVVREDPVRRGLLYAGTETGIHVSFDDGAHWQPLQRNLPVSPVWDLTVAEDDLVVATHGRAIWVLDDVGPLRTMTEATAEREVHLFEPTPVHRVRDGFESLRTPHGENPPVGAVVDYSLKEAPRGPVELTILDSDGELVGTFSSADSERDRDPYGKSSRVGTRAGLNRFHWDLRYPGPELIPGHVLFMHPPPAPPVGPLALPGTYRVRLTVGGETREATLTVLPDPRLDVPDHELAAQFDLHRRMVEALSTLYRSVASLRDARAQLVDLRQRAEKKGREAEAVAAAAARLEERLTTIENELLEPRMETYADAFHYPTRLDNKLVLLIGIVANSDRAPTEQSYEVFDGLTERVQTLLGELETIYESDVPELNRLAEAHGVAAVVPREQS